MPNQLIVISSGAVPHGLSVSGKTVAIELKIEVDEDGKFVSLTATDKEKNNYDLCIKLIPTSSTESVQDVCCCYDSEGNLLYCYELPHGQACLCG